MGVNQLTIDTASFFDNPADRQVEFSAAIGGDRYDFAVRYAVLEALGATPPLDRPATLAMGHADEIARAALVALGRADADSPVIVTEADLAQTADGHAGPAADAFSATGSGSETEAHPS